MGSRKDKDSNLDLKKLAADMENQKDGAAEAERRKEDAMNRTIIGFVTVRDLWLLACVSGIYVCYLYYGYLQERITKVDYGESKERFKFTFFLVFVQCLFNTGIAVAVSKRYDNPRDVADVPWNKFALIGFSYIAAMFCSNYSLHYVDYPTQVLAKSCKPIPVMLIGVLLLRKSYPWIKYACVLAVTVGISVFLLNRGSSKASAESHTSTVGLIFLACSLGFDGFTGNLQERVIKAYKPSTHQLMYSTNMYAVAYLAIALLVTGELFDALQFCARFPEVFGHIILFSCASALGQNFIFLTLNTFGALVLSTVTTTRKFFTILFSVFWFGKALVPNQWLGILLVFVGLGTDVVISKWKPKGKAPPVDAKK